MGRLPVCQSRMVLSHLRYRRTRAFRGRPLACFSNSFELTQRLDVFFISSPATKKPAPYVLACSFHTPDAGGLIFQFPYSLKPDMRLSRLFLVVGGLAN